VWINEDRCNAARESFHLFHFASINPHLLEILDSRGTEQIASDARNHEDIGAAQTSGDCLVGSLATKPEIKLLTEDSLAGFRKLFRKRCEIDVCTADYGDSGTLCHNFSLDAENGRV
jgi:hypothetical protein